MAANNNPIFPQTLRFSSIGLTLMNYAKGGTVSFGVTNSPTAFYNVYTAGGNGSRIDQIKVRSLGVNPATVLRLFVNDGTTNYLVHESTLAAVGSAGSALTVSAQNANGSSFTTSTTHGLVPGQVIYVTNTSTLTALATYGAYYIASTPSTTTFTLNTSAGTFVTVGSSITGAGASITPFSTLESSASADYDITISKNTSETASPIPYLPSTYKIVATIGATSSTIPTMGWQVNVFGGDY